MHICLPWRCRVIVNISDFIWFSDCFQELQNRSGLSSLCCSMNYWVSVCLAFSVSYLQGRYRFHPCAVIKHKLWKDFVLFLSGNNHIRWEMRPSSGTASELWWKVKGKSLWQSLVAPAEIPAFINLWKSGSRVLLLFSEAVQKIQTGKPGKYKPVSRLALVHLLRKAIGENYLSI